MPVTTPSLRRSARVLQPQNIKVPFSPDELPARKRVKREEEEEKVQKKEVKEMVKKEVKEEATNGENASPTTTSNNSVLSEYEQMVQRNIAERQRLLESMGILKAKEEFSSCVKESQKKPVYRGIIREKKSPEPVMRRRSLRQQNLTPDGLHLSLPSDVQVAQAERRSTVTSREEEHPRPPPGPAPLMDYYKAQNKVNCEGMLTDLACSVSTSCISSTMSSSDVWGGTMESVVKKMKKMHIEEEWVVKVVPDRIFSVQFHPTVEKTLVLVGGKWGQLGILDVGREDESNGAYCFHPHSRPINCLSVAASSPHHVHSTSYDGSLRQTDLEAGIVQELYALTDNQHNSFLCWHSQQDTHNFLVGASLGRVLQVDTRVSEGLVKQYLVHERKTVKVISGHPHHPHYYATGSNDGYVSLWDLRNHKNNKPLDSVIHGRAISGVEFSQTGNALISTSMDDYLRIITCDRTALTVKRKIRHYNQTGRWLTTFKARFVPTRDDLVFVGSMRHPRRVEVWGCDGLLHHHFHGPLVTSVSSVVALHPFRPALAGCNSSGKVHVFM
ncbi:WD repeat-containing protein 76-like isoform X2 [Scylla paramamosain]